MCDWTAAEHEYVTGDAGYAAIAQKHGVTKTAVGNYGKKHDWVRKREQFKEETRTRLAQKTSEQVAEQLSQIKDNLIEASLLLSQKILDDMRSGRSLKPYEYGHYTSSIMDLYKLLPEESDPLQGNVTVMFASEEMSEYGS